MTKRKQNDKKWIWNSWKFISRSVLTLTLTFTKSFYCTRKQKKNEMIIQLKFILPWKSHIMKMEKYNLMTISSSKKASSIQWRDGKCPIEIAFAVDNDWRGKTRYFTAFEMENLFLWNHFNFIIQKHSVSNILLLLFKASRSSSTIALLLCSTILFLFFSDAACGMS